MHRLICAFVVRIWQNRFSHGSYPSAQKCAGWSESLLGIHVILQVLLCPNTTGTETEHSENYRMPRLRSACTKSSQNAFVNVNFLSMMNEYDKMSHLTRKHVFRSLRPGKTQTGLLSYRSKMDLETLDIASIGIIVSKQWKQRHWSDCVDGTRHVFPMTWLINGVCKTNHGHALVRRNFIPTIPCPY